MTSLREIVERTDAELDQLIREQRERLGVLAIEMRTKKITNVKESAGLKRTIARALTIQHQRHLTRLENQS